jgi:hypothetical protein
LRSMPLPEPQGEHKFAIDEKYYTFHQLDILFTVKWQSTSMLKDGAQCTSTVNNKKYAMYVGYLEP